MPCLKLKLWGVYTHTRIHSPLVCRLCRGRPPPKAAAMSARSGQECKALAPALIFKIPGSFSTHANKRPLAATPLKLRADFKPLEEGVQPKMEEHRWAPHNLRRMHEIWLQLMTHQFIFSVKQFIVWSLQCQKMVKNYDFCLPKLKTTSSNVMF